MSIVFVFSGWPTVKLQQISTKNHARPITDDDEGEKSSCRQLLPTPTWLLATGLAYHLQTRDLQMPVLGVGLLDACVGCGRLGVFLQVVRLGIRNHALQSYGVAHMIGKIDGGVAVNFPRAAVLASEQVLASAVTL
jgi:hypothetical protein